MKKFLYILLVLFGLILIFCFALAFKKPSGLSEKPEWGVAFSKPFSIDMGLDWKESYLAILTELKPKYLRLPVYWQDVEPQTGIYNFEDYDWMVEKARENNVKIVLVIGRKLPRWPECHIPNWAIGLSDDSQKVKVLKLLPEIVNHFKNNENLYAWQVENEPFLPFGECPASDADFLDKEISLVKFLDSGRPIMVTDSGELSIWLRAAKRADIFGTTLYRMVWNKTLGYFEYPIPYHFFWFKANLTHIFYSGKPIIISELQAEPWGPKMPYETSLEDQEKSMNLAQFNKNVVYAKKTGFPQIYLWGAEWWYWMKIKQNRPEFWERAKAVINN